MPSNNTGSECLVLGARSEEGSRQQLAQTEGPGARRGRRGQQIGRDSHGPEGAEGADPVGDKIKGQTQMDAAP